MNVLIDSGSTFNFVKQVIAQKLSLLQVTIESFEVLLVMAVSFSAKLNVGIMIQEVPF